MKTGPVFLIPVDRAKVLIELIDELGVDDRDLIGLRNHLSDFTGPFALVCVAEEDFVLWPDGPDIRDYQLGGRDSKVTIIHGDEVYSNDPADLPSAAMSRDE